MAHELFQAAARPRPRPRRRITRIRCERKPRLSRNAIVTNQWGHPYAHNNALGDVSGSQGLRPTPVAYTPYAGAIDCASRAGFYPLAVRGEGAYAPACSRFRDRQRFLVQSDCRMNGREGTVAGHNTPEARMANLGPDWPNLHDREAQKPGAPAGWPWEGAWPHDKCFWGGGWTDRHKLDAAFAGWKRGQPFDYMQEQAPDFSLPA